MATINWRNPDNYRMVPTNEVSHGGLCDTVATAEAEDKPYQLYRLAILDSDGHVGSGVGEMIWWPRLNRAGIAWGAEAQWTEADCPEDAIYRWAKGQMAVRPASSTLPSRQRRE